jgi:hypothetical protein
MKGSIESKLTEIHLALVGEFWYARPVITRRTTGADSKNGGQ